MAFPVGDRLTLRATARVRQRKLGPEGPTLRLPVLMSLATPGSSDLQVGRLYNEKLIMRLSKSLFFPELL